MFSDENYDSLTGIHTRKSIHHFLETSVVEAQAKDSTVAVISFDIDQLKHYNGYYSLPGGDCAIITISQIIISVVNGRGAVGRVSGDEFLVVLPLLTRLNALVIAEEVRSTCAFTPVKIARPYIDMEIPLCPPVTVTAGVLCFPNDGDMANIRERVERIIELGKNSGGNRVVSSEICF